MCVCVSVCVCMCVSVCLSVCVYQGEVDAGEEQRHALEAALQRAWTTIERQV